MMDIDIAAQLKAIDREVTRRPGPEGEEVNVRIRRSYDGAIDDVWQALTDPDRIKRWFIPITGDLREGGTFSLYGNADGEILRCDPPQFLKVTWGAPNSLVQVTLSADGDDRTTLVLDHTVPIEMAQSGAGALFVGPGWDGAVAGLDLYLTGKAPADPVEAANSPEVVELNRQSIEAWLAAVEASGTATPEEIESAMEMTLAQYVPQDPETA